MCGRRLNRQETIILRSLIFFVSLGVASARANERVDGCLRRIFEKAGTHVVGKREYPPIKVPQQAQVDEIFAAFIREKEMLAKWGVKYKTSATATYLENLVAREKIRADKNFFLGQVLEIQALPPPVRRATLNTPALKHPEMESYLSRMKKVGYVLGVDTSISLTGAGAFHRASDHLIGINSATSWQSFLHEFQHLEFAQYAAPHLAEARRAVKKAEHLRDALPADVLEAWGPKRTEHLEKLLRKHLPTNAINETMAVEAELNALGLRRYLPGRGTYAALYALRHQITDLRELAQIRALTPREVVTLAEAKVRYGLIESWEKSHDLLAAAGLGLAVGAYAWKTWHFDPARYSAVYYDEEGNMVGVTYGGGGGGGGGGWGWYLDHPTYVYTRNTPLGPIIDHLRQSSTGNSAGITTSTPTEPSPAPSLASP